MNQFKEESLSLRLKFNIEPCLYPEYNILDNKWDYKSIVDNAVTVDCPETRDYDDALSWNPITKEIGIHITEVASKLPLELKDWVIKRQASAYWTSEDFKSKNTPLLPSDLSENVFSLKSGTIRPCRSLFLKPDSYRFEKTMVNISANLTYKEFAIYDSDLKDILASTFDTNIPEEQIATAMIVYNRLALKHIDDPLYRVDGEFGSATYDWKGIHSKFNGPYIHITSPIRRFADLFNQSQWDNLGWKINNLKELQEKNREISKFHRLESRMTLGYMCKDNPIRTKAKVLKNNDKTYLLVTIRDKNFKIDTESSFYSYSSETEFDIEIYGLVINGRMDIKVKTLSKLEYKFSINPMKRIVPTEEYQDILNREDISKELTSLLKHPLDSFQEECLDRLLKDEDLIVSAPTGSGKTAIALIALYIQSYKRDSKCILTCPVKALSNQKYLEFNSIFPNQVSLLTGDVELRSKSENKFELIIMTAEILAAKLEMRKKYIDKDLLNIKCIILDEVHYISGDRGSVWERILMNSPSDIRITALSATLAKPEKLAFWMNNRRPTSLIISKNRSVPLHIGYYDKKRFVEIYPNMEDEKKDVKPSTIQNIVSILNEENKFPAIIFFLSRSKCVSTTQSIKGNYLSEEEKLKQLCFEDLYLRNFQRSDESILFFNMLHRGIAYHQAGMIPVLREYVEILFQNKLLKIILATETLGVGLNMPCRTVVFTQMDKPIGNFKGFRDLNSGEFWQMAGRAGRRGKDIKGYVIYCPLVGHKILKIENLKNIMTNENREICSNFQIDDRFVLHSLIKGDYSGSVLSKTLIHYEHTRYIIENKITFNENKDEYKKYKFGLMNDWNNSVKWLRNHNFIDDSMNLTIKGHVASCFSEGEAMLRAYIVSDKFPCLSNINLICWLSIFCEPLPFKDEISPTFPNDILKLSLDLKELVKKFEVGNLGWRNPNIVSLWLSSYDVSQISRYIDYSQLGNFIKMLSRIDSMLNEMKIVSLGLERLDLYKSSEEAKSIIYSGIINKNTLYV